MTGDGAGARPSQFALYANYLNPFNLSTRIQFQTSSEGRATLDVTNILGERVATLVDTDLSPGLHTAAWNGHNVSGVEVPSGVYFWRLHTDDHTASEKMLLLK